MITELQSLRDRALGAEARVRELEAALTDAIELADEGWAYAGPYFVEKWQFKERITALQAALHPAPTDEDKPTRFEVRTPDLMTGKCFHCGQRRPVHDDDTLACPSGATDTKDED